ncbi:MAG: tRNA (adenosine(37)-N6)-dimethylallyltransferase MiaA [Parcubacteria group bacterium]|nr:tRNA (adenosine(37)-N6)-dimethylallyltransferase MiaA [Parcubacteria group bacterium]
MENRKPKIIVIVGPTASGKSALAIKIALRLRSGQAKKFGFKGAEIVSSDSRQVYRGMDIGTAKPTKEEMTTVPHHLIDIKNPDENYTVAEYKRDAVKAINEIIKNKKIPILVGGTGLYIKAVVDNLNIPEVAPDIKLRKKLEKEIEKYGLKYVFGKLIKLNPEAAYIVDPNNPRRIIRALEIAIKTKKPFSAQRKTGKPLFDFIEIGIEWLKNILNERINKRVDLMIKDGLLEEVKNLVQKYGPKQQSFDAIGYREIIEYIKNKKCQYKTDRLNTYTLTKNAFDEMVDLIKKNTRNYAKRQMTWFRKDKRIHWIKNEQKAEKLVKNFLFQKFF